MKGIFRVLQSRGGGVRRIWGSHGFQGEPREDQSPLTEYKGGNCRKLTANEGDFKSITEPGGGGVRRIWGII